MCICLSAKVAVNLQKNVSPRPFPLRPLTLILPTPSSVRLLSPPFPFIYSPPPPTCSETWAKIRQIIRIILWSHFRLLRGTNFGCSAAFSFGVLAKVLNHTNLWEFFQLLHKNWSSKQVLYRPKNKCLHGISKASWHSKLDPVLNKIDATLHSSLGFCVTRPAN